MRCLCTNSAWSKAERGPKLNLKFGPRWTFGPCRVFCGPRRAVTPRTWLPIIRLIGDAQLGKQHGEPVRLYQFQVKWDVGVANIWNRRHVSALRKWWFICQPFCGPVWLSILLSSILSIHYRYGSYRYGLKYCPHSLTARKILSFYLPFTLSYKYGFWSRIISSCAFNYR